MRDGNMGQFAGNTQAVAVAAFPADEASFVSGSDYAVDGGQTQP